MAKGSGGGGGGGRGNNGGGGGSVSGNQMEPKMIPTSAWVEKMERIAANKSNEEITSMVEKLDVVKQVNFLNRLRVEASKRGLPFGNTLDDRIIGDQLARVRKYGNNARPLTTKQISVVIRMNMPAFKPVKYPPAPMNKLKGNG